MAEFPSGKYLFFSTGLVLSLTMGMDKIQLVFFFVNGYLLSRLAIRWKMADYGAQMIIGKSRGSLLKSAVYVLVFSALVSFFIPNVIAALATIPVINRLLKTQFPVNGMNSSFMATLFALAVIWGSNIGGVGAITSTPANGILAGFVEIGKIPGKEMISFLPWLTWGIPLVVFSLGMAIFLLALFIRFHKANNTPTEFRHPDSVKVNHLGKAFFHTGLVFMAYYFAGSFVLSTWLYFTGDIIAVIATAVYSLWFYYWLFFRGFKIKGQNIPYLGFLDLFREIPWKGLVYVGIAFVVGFFLFLSGMDKKIFEFLKSLNHFSYSFWFLAGLVLVASFSTEVLSNTVVQVSLLAIIAATPPPGGSILISMLAITFGSTSAFMSPIATGVNGLVFGGIPHISLPRMLFWGFLMNILAGMITAGWLHLFIPFVMSF